jgi:hypothetical protein
MPRRGTGWRRRGRDGSDIARKPWQPPAPPSVAQGTCLQRSAGSWAVVTSWPERLHALDDFSGLASLDIHMAYLYLLTGRLEESIDRCAQGLRRLGPGGGEQWVRSYLLVITGLALFLQGKPEDSGAASRASLEMKVQLGDVVGTAYCLEMLAWLAAGQQGYERAAWLLGAADSLWDRAGTRLGGNAILEESRQQAERAARGALGGDRYAVLREDAGRRPLREVVTVAVGDAGQFSLPGRGDRARSLTRREHEIAAGGRRNVQPGDRRAAGHLQAHGRCPCRAHPGQARRLVPGADRQLGPGRRAAPAVAIPR